MRWKYCVHEGTDFNGGSSGPHGTTGQRRLRARREALPKTVTGLGGGCRFGTGTREQRYFRRCLVPSTYTLPGAREVAVARHPLVLGLSGIGWVSLGVPLRVASMSCCYMGSVMPRCRYTVVGSGCDVLGAKTLPGHGLTSQT